MVTPAPPVSDYIGRTVDHIMLDDMQPSGDVELTQALVKPGESGALVTGIQKLVQRFFLELMTERASFRYLPERGCTFLMEGRAGAWRTPVDVEQSFYGSMIAIEQNLITEEDTNDPLDEKFGGAELISVSVNVDRVTMRVRVRSLAGDSREVIYPLRVNSVGV